MRKYFGCLLSILVAVPLRGVWIDTKWTDFQQGTYDAELYISRRLQQETNPSDSGCIEYHARFDVNNDGYYDLVSADGKGPNLRVWLGSASGYSAGNCLTYPITFGGNCDISDLNLDGYPELIHSGYAMDNLCIYWGTPTGPSPTDTTLLPNDSAEAVYIADLDKDTYLDIVGTRHSQNTYIYWGSSSGYSIANRTNIGPGGEHNIEVADLDKNGYLDIIVTKHRFPYDIIIFYQDSARYFSPQSLNFADTNYTHGLSIGDLNNDGYIDIVATGNDNITHSSIYWGSSSGYSDGDKLNLNPGQCYGGSAVADFNEDTWLDILYYRYGSAKPIIYYNSGSSPWFSDADTHEIGIALTASGGTVADFNKDGNLDVFVNNWTANSYSYVFYGPTFISYDSLPVNADHHGTFRESRQIPNYYSRVVRPCSLVVDDVITSGNCSWIDSTPGNSVVHIFVRSGNTSIPDTLWTDWYEVGSNPGSLPWQVTERKYIQYRAELYWDNPAELPNLERVEMDISCGSLGIKGERCEAEFELDIISWATNVTIRYRLGNKFSDGSLTIFDIAGREVYKKRRVQNTGSIKWGQYNLPGVYFCVLKSGEKQITRKFIKF